LTEKAQKVADVPAARTEPGPSLRRLITNRYAWLLAATIVAALALLIFGLYGTWSEHDKVVSTVTLVLSFAGFVLAVLQAYPGIIRHTTGAWKIINYAGVLVFLLSSASAIFLVVQKPVIRIGVSLPLSQADKQDGMSMLQAVRLAVEDEQSNRIDNYDIDAVALDDHGTGDPVEFSTDLGADLGKSARLADVVADAHLVGMVGPFNSRAALFEIPVASAAGVPLISPANTLGCLTGAPSCVGVEAMPQHSTYLRLASTDAVRARAVVDYLKGRHVDADRQGGPQAVVYSDLSPFGDGLANEFLHAWHVAYPKGAVPRKISVAEGIKDARNQKKAPAIVVFAGTGSDGITLYRKIQQNKKNANVTFVGAATIMNPVFTSELSGGIHGKLYAITPFPYDADSDAVQKFRDRFATEYGNQPTPYAVVIYDATRALISSVRAAVAAGYRPPVVGRGPFMNRKTRELRQQVMRNLRGLNRPGGVSYAGITGQFTFDGNGDGSYDNATSAGQVSIYQYVDNATGDPIRGWRLAK
jgi:ABC-type branched-subunit amino acid transport system substrate-binding protein